MCPSPPYQTRDVVLVAASGRTSSTAHRASHRRKKAQEPLVKLPRTPCTLGGRSAKDIARFQGAHGGANSQETSTRSRQRADSSSPNRIIAKPEFSPPPQRFSRASPSCAFRLVEYIS